MKIKVLAVLLGVTLISPFPALILADSMILSPCDFNQNEDDNDYWFDTGSLYVKAGSFARRFTAPVHLPQNARVTSIIVFYKDSYLDGNVEVKFRKRNAYTESEMIMASFKSSGAVPGKRSEKIFPIRYPKIDNRGYTYNVSVYFTNPHSDDLIRICFVKIIYDLS